MSVKACAMRPGVINSTRCEMHDRGVWECLRELNQQRDACIKALREAERICYSGQSFRLGARIMEAIGPALGIVEGKG